MLRVHGAPYSNNQGEDALQKMMRTPKQFRSKSSNSCLVNGLLVMGFLYIKVGFRTAILQQQKESQAYSVNA